MSQCHSLNSILGLNLPACLDGQTRRLTPKSGTFVNFLELQEKFSRKLPAAKGPKCVHLHMNYIAGKVRDTVKMFVGIYHCLKISKEMINAQCKKTQCGSDAWWQAKGAAKLMSCCFCRILGSVSLLYITMWLCHHHHCIVSIFTLHKNSLNDTRPLR